MGMSRLVDVIKLLGEFDHATDMTEKLWKAWELVDKHGGYLVKQAERLQELGKENKRLTEVEEIAQNIEKKYNTLQEEYRGYYEGVEQRVEELKRKRAADELAVQEFNNIAKEAIERYEIAYNRNERYKRALEELESRALQEINLGNQIDPNEVVDIVRQDA